MMQGNNFKDKKTYDEILKYVVQLGFEVNNVIYKDNNECQFSITSLKKWVFVIRKDEKLYFHAFYKGFNYVEQKNVNRFNEEVENIYDNIVNNILEIDIYHIHSILECFESDYNCESKWYVFKYLSLYIKNAIGFIQNLFKNK